MNETDYMKNRYGKINLKVIDTSINWFIGNFDDFIIKYNLEDSDLENNYMGLTFNHEGEYYIYSNGYDIYNTIPHETVHVVSMICDHRDILFDKTNHEMIAYLVGYISGQILDQKKKSIKKKRTKRKKFF